MLEVHPTLYLSADGSGGPLQEQLVVDLTPLDKLAHHPNSPISKSEGDAKAPLQMGHIGKPPLTTQSVHLSKKERKKLQQLQISHFFAPCNRFSTQIQCLFWNVRGLNHNDKQPDVKQVLRREHCSFFSLIDTKLDSLAQQQFCSRICPSFSSNFAPHGRIGIFWLPEQLEAEESFLRQKSQQQWLELGDRNSKFFYASIKARSSRNTISCLRALDGSLYTHPDEIKEYIVSYYSRLLNRDTGTPVTPMKFPSAVTQSQNAKLIDTITSEEISHSFIAPVPKSASTESLDGYRPISLCNTLYKILTKIMASRLQEVLPQIVSVHQTAFIKGRSIHHNILLAHELVNYLDKGGKSRACVKIDLRKAFDSVRWQYLQEVLRGFQFSES
ncbi:hypothetical protein QJS04_geneDACA016277 [Acorus gramineus]|uniref:Reverse transcriptase domain-containing protein n=1 Tax=Acorus gramineus TaxID=55184 RepID=A0AAV8ZYI1_ACOGR|nr:hypothetical protein QJS04_geneDACA016277 [Acorus gramineus]